MGQCNRGKVLGKKFSSPKLNYVYTTIVREPGDQLDLIEGDGDDEDGENEEETKPEKKAKEKDSPEKKPKLKFCKMKFDTSYPDGKILTKVFVRSKDTKLPMSQRVTEVKVSCASDLDEYLRFKSKVRIIGTLNKLWASKAKNESGIRKFGTGFKILQIEIEPSDSVSGRETLSKYAFDNGDGETLDVENKSNEQPAQVTQPAQTSQPTQPAKVDAKVDTKADTKHELDGQADGEEAEGEAEGEEEEDQDLEEDQEEEEVKPVVKPKEVPKQQAQVQAPKKETPKETPKETAKEPAKPEAPKKPIRKVNR